MAHSLYDWLLTGQTIVPNSLLKHYKQLALSADEFVLIVYILAQLNPYHATTEIDTLSDMLGWELSEVMDVLNELMTKQLVAIELIETTSGKKSEHVTLRPLFDKIESFSNKTEALGTDSTIQDVTAPQTSELVVYVEKTFGRVLTASELDMMNQWLVRDNYEIGLIREAIKEATLRNIFNFKYIDRILLNWEQKNIKTAQEAQYEARRFQGQQPETASNTSQVDLPFVEWKTPPLS
ncbi:MAG: DnaD domain protein [Aerococcaceae bacterium]|nr:DnaD domain protein [Aerococcaceae bacterium]